MTPPPAAGRLSTLGCVLLAATALALPGCGGGGAAGAESTAATSPGQQARASGGDGKPCPAQVDAFVKSLDSLRSRLAVGLSYEQYAGAIEGLRADYEAIDVDRLALECLTTAGTPSERAFNEYIAAANAWGRCLADAACTTASVEPVLQRRWRVASGLLAEAQ